jgi:hypothetical protein
MSELDAFASTLYSPLHVHAHRTWFPTPVAGPAGRETARRDRGHPRRWSRSSATGSWHSKKWALDVNVAGGVSGWKGRSVTTVGVRRGSYGREHA